MKLQAWLKQSSQELAEQGVDSANLDSQLLACLALGESRTWLHAHPETELSGEQVTKLNSLMTRRAGGEPIAYIIGSKEFYGRDFVVARGVLVPRPESEDFISIVKSLPANLEFIDIGTGSGILAISAALEQPGWSGVATDISEVALRVAQNNAKILGAKNLVFRKQNLLVKDAQDYDIVLANLPYVPQNLFNKPDLACEPPIALFAGRDGLDLYRQLFKQLATRKHKPRHLLTESLESQHSEMQSLAKTANYELLETRGLVQHFTAKQP